jgi:3-oxoadipate enol-lactonase
VTEYFVQHDGIRFRCRIDGSVGLPWMVFSNSLVTDLTIWDPQVTAFAGRYRILRYDQRGHGGTDVPSKPATIVQLAEDASALMTHFGVTDAVFVGVSMGAATGFCLAPRLPDQIARLVASDGQAATAPGGAKSWQDRIDAAVNRGSEALADATVARWFSAKSRAEASPAILEIRAMVARMKLDGFVACARALQNYDFGTTLAAIKQPTLLIAGAEDGAMPRTMRALAELIPNSRFVEIADAGHIPGFERPEAFNAALEQFLR